MGRHLSLVEREVLDVIATLERTRAQGRDVDELLERWRWRRDVLAGAPQGAGWAYLATRGDSFAVAAVEAERRNARRWRIGTLATWASLVTVCLSILLGWLDELEVSEVLGLVGVLVHAALATTFDDDMAAVAVFTSFTLPLAMSKKWPKERNREASEI